VVQSGGNRVADRKRIEAAIAIPEAAGNEVPPWDLFHATGGVAETIFPQTFTSAVAHFDTAAGYALIATGPNLARHELSPEFHQQHGDRIRLEVLADESLPKKVRLHDNGNLPLKEFQLLFQRSGKPGAREIVPPTPDSGLATGPAGLMNML